MADIFICYRTDDGAYEAAQLNHALTEKYGADRIFIDLTMAPGTRYPDAIRGAVNAAKVVLAVIGPRWATATDKAGRLCLEDPADWVRQELAIAFRTGIPVVPVMLDDAKLPSRQLLPADLRDIRQRQRCYLRRRTLHADRVRLVHQLEQVVPGLVPLPRDQSEGRPKRYEMSNEASNGGVIYGNQGGTMSINNGLFR